MYLYELMETYDLFGGRTSYGILAKRCEDGVIRETAFVPGISHNKGFVLNLMERCDRYQLSPIHLLDVVTDALS